MQNWIRQDHLSPKSTNVLTKVQTVMVRLPENFVDYTKQNFDWTKHFETNAILHV